MITPATAEQGMRIVATFDDAAGTLRRALDAISHNATPLAEVNALLDDARTTLRTLGDDADSTEWVLSDARAAADELLETLGKVRRARTRYRRPELTVPLRTAIDGAESIGRRLRLVAHDDAAVASGAMPAWRPDGGAPTRAGSAAEVERILAKANDDVTDGELWRLALIEELPSSMRPEFPSRGPLSAPLSKLVVREDLADRFRPQAPNKVWVDGELNSLRMTVQAPRYAETATRESATRDLARVLAKSEVGHEDLRQVALVAHLPDGVRPDMPEALVRPMQRAYVHGFLPRHQLVTGIEFQRLREHVLSTEPEVMSSALRARVEEGQPISQDFATALTAMDETQLAQVGLTREGLLAQILQGVGGTKQGFGWGREQLIAARSLARDIHVDEAQQPLLDDLRGRIDRAIALTERRFDEGSRTYATNAIADELWPDFGDVGRMAGTADLFAAMRTARDEAATAAATTARAGESLAW